MKEHPILFSAPMVRAILAGTKTQTRRVMRVQPEFVGVRGGKNKRACWSFLEGLFRGDAELTAAFPNDEYPGPFGMPGDRLWVRETWAPHPDGDDSGVVYRATDPGWDDANTNLKWRPSIYMPRWASRITLEITSVRVERVHAISDDDIRAEGVPTDDRLWLPGECDDDDREDPREVGYEPRRVGAWARDNWMRLWISINGAESWASNPWVWALTFRRVAS